MAPRNELDMQSAKMRLTQARVHMAIAAEQRDESKKAEAELDAQALLFDGLLHLQGKQAGDLHGTDDVIAWFRQSGLYLPGCNQEMLDELVRGIESARKEISSPVPTVVSKNDSVSELADADQNYYDAVKSKNRLMQMLKEERKRARKKQT